MTVINGTPGDFSERNDSLTFIQSYIHTRNFHFTLGENLLGDTIGEVDGFCAQRTAFQCGISKKINNKECHFLGVGFCMIF